jgi:anti-anti-sigma factor
MRIDVDHLTDANCTLIRPVGRFIDAHENTDFFERISEEVSTGCSRFVVDLSGLSHINSTGINLIVKTVKFLNDHKARIIFANPPEHISELLSVIKLNAILEITPTVDSGVQIITS